jgi:citrate lyase gamma subunit
MKIQLDSSALAYLIENSDEDFKLELQSSVVQAFAKRYLKALITEPLMKEVQKELELFMKGIQREIQKEIVNTLGKAERISYSDKYELISMSLETRQVIAEIVNDNKEDAIRQLLTEYSLDINKEMLLSLLTKEYKNQIRDIVRKEVTAELVNKIKE